MLFISICGSIRIKKYILYIITGVAEATFLLGTHYASGEGFINNAPDMQKAYECYLDSATKGLSIAQHNLACLLFEGPIPLKSQSLSHNAPYPKDPPLAIHYWTLAASQSLPLASLNLAQIYLSGYDPNGEAGEPKKWKIERNLANAKKWVNVTEKMLKLQVNSSTLSAQSMSHRPLNVMSDASISNNNTSALPIEERLQFLHAQIKQAEMESTDNSQIKNKCVLM